jgi:hypothetical protein
VLKLLFFSVIFAVCSNLPSCKNRETPEAEMKIIGGSELSEDQFPSVRKLKIFKRHEDGSHTLSSTCSMTFIKPNVALTAGHCLCHGDRYVFSDKARWDDFISVKASRHPLYKCAESSPNKFDVGLIWFDGKVAIPVSPLIGINQQLRSNAWTLVGYGNNILKVTGSFWRGGRVIVKETSRPSPRKGEREFDGKHSGEVEWSGKTSDGGGFFSLSAEFDITRPVHSPVSGEVASGEGDSGGAVFTRGDDTLIGVMSRGGEKFSGFGSNKVTCYTDVIDLRRPDIQSFIQSAE